MVRELEGIHREVLEHDVRATRLKRILDKTRGIDGVLGRIEEVRERVEKLRSGEISIGHESRNPRRVVDAFLKEVRGAMKETEKIVNTLRSIYDPETLNLLRNELGPYLDAETCACLEEFPQSWSSLLGMLKKMRKDLRHDYVSNKGIHHVISPIDVDTVVGISAISAEGILDTLNLLYSDVQNLIKLRNMSEEIYREVVRRRNALAERYGRRLGGILELHGVDADVPDDPEKLLDLARAAIHRSLPDIIDYMRRTGEKKLDAGIIEKIAQKLVAGTADKMQRLHPEISALLRLEGLSPRERLRLLRKVGSIDPNLLRVATKIFEKDRLEPADVEWLLQNRDRLASAFHHVDPSVGRSFLDLVERLETIAKIREKGLPRIDATNVEDAKKVLQHDLLPVILNNWEIWASNVKTWADLYEALERLRITREYNTKGVIRPTNIPEAPSIRERLSMLIKGAAVHRMGNRIVVVGLPRSRAEEAAKLLGELGVLARVDYKGRLVVEGAPSGLRPPEEQNILKILGKLSNKKNAKKGGKR